MAATVLTVKCMRNFILTCLLSLAALHVAVAEEAVVDPPSRVARLSYLDGDVSLAPAGTQEWAQAILNRPLTTGDRVWVDSGARAELQLGSASVHLDQGSGFSFLELDDDLLHMKLTDGAATIRVQRKRDNERVEIDTPNTTVALLHPGEYHVEVTAAGDTIVKTRSGESEVQGAGNSYTVRANEEGVFKGTAELTAEINPLGPRTAFEDWANDRDRRDEGSVSARYVSPEVIGYEDLDRDGEWISESGYGYVWRPTYVAAGWAPYRYGRWVWVSPWGWNWIDDARWGFAPSHYGRWAYLRSRWCWVPGPRHIRPVYAPALVAWTGRPGFNVSVSFGSGVGWFPLGPRELYVPGYRYSRHYLHDVNASNTIIVNNNYITNIYNGRGYNGRGGRFNYRYGHDVRAVTVVDRDRFVGGRPIDGHYSHPSERDLRRWHHDARPPAITPDRDSVFAARRVDSRPFNRANAAREHTRFADRRAAGTRISFAAERQAIAANGGRPIGRSQLRANPQAHSQVNNSQVNSEQANVQANSPSRASPQPRGDFRAAREQPRDANRVRTDRPGNALQRDAAQRDAAMSNATGGAAIRQLEDRPAWARQRRDGSSRYEPQGQRESRPAAIADRLRQDRTHRSAEQPAARAPAAALRNDNERSGSAPSMRDESRRQWRGDNTPHRVQRDVQRTPRDSVNLRDRSTNRGNALNRPAHSQPAQPRYSAPREQPRPQAQPRAPQPHVERAAPQRSMSQRPSRQQNNAQRSGQPRSFGRPSPRQ